VIFADCAAMFTFLYILCSNLGCGESAISQPACEILQIAIPRKLVQFGNNLQINAFRLNFGWHGMCNGV